MPNMCFTIIGDGVSGGAAFGSKLYIQLGQGSVRGRTRYQAAAARENDPVSSTKV